MAPRTETIQDWCRIGLLPDEQEFYGTLVEDNGLFVAAEGAQWDFKDEWPFSLSNDYFGGICRLICAFANTSGGIIIFGVHDAKRTGGHNKVVINLDRFNQALQQTLGALPDLILKSFVSEQFGDVDALLVRPRPRGIAPFRFGKSIGKYRQDVIWVRNGHEVLTAAPPQFPILFCRAEQTYGSDAAPALDGSIPPSPATLRRFVGRTEVLDRLFHWLESSDEPRTYLHGKGGSGKTTIAYEFARLVKEHGTGLRLHGGDPIDAVIFLSAKEKTLNPIEGQIAEVESPDFSNETDLLRSLLFYGGWTKDRAYLNASSIETLRTEAAQYFEMTSVIIVLDDVDTLTTKGVDPGSDFIYRTLCRSKRSSKVVYTLRNAPSQSLTNSIEVPGLLGADYEKFVSECSQQFSVPQPSAEFRDRKLPELSERRPLVIESVIALVRTAGSYDRAAELFSQHAGENVRDYVFIREWDAIKGSGLSKLLLAALSETKEPASFVDLQAVLQAEASLVKDAIGAVREMFLQVDEAGNDALYSLAPLTRNFVANKRSDLVGYGQLRERIRAFKRDVQISNPRVAVIVAKVERLLPVRLNEHTSDRVAEAYRLVTERQLPPAVTEDPLFKCVLGYVCACFQQPHFAEARDAFEYAISMRYEPEFKFLRAWFNAERGSGVNDGRCMRIADLVIEGKRYDEKDKITMVGRKATSLYARARERVFTDVVDAMKDFQDALTLHLRAFRLYCLEADYRSDTSETYARNTAFQLFDLVARSSSPWELIERLTEIASHKDIYLDPLEEPIREALKSVLALPQKPDALSRMRNRLKGLDEAMRDQDRWLANHVSKSVGEILRAAEITMAERVRALRPA